MKFTIMKTILPFDSLGSFIIYSIGALAVFFTGIIAAMITTGVIIIADTISGIWASRRRNEPFRSDKFSNLIAKFFLYQIVIICAHAIDVYMINMPIFLYATLAAISSVEFSSIVENVYKATGVNLIKAINNFLKRHKDES